MSANILESFFVALGFEVDTDKIDEFKKKTEELRESAITLGSIFTGAAAGIGLLVEGVASAMGDISSFAELNEVSSRSVAALGRIAAENDGSLEGMKSTIQSLNRTIGEAALGVGRGAMTFEKLGLSAKGADGHVKKVDEILGDVADKMQKMSRQEQIAMAEKLGIDPQFVKVLEKGSANLAKLREEAELMNPFSEKDYELADQVDKQFMKAKATVGTFAKMLGVSLLPTVNEVLKGYLEWFKASRKATSEETIRGLKLMAGAVGTVWDWMMRLIHGLKNVYDWLVQFKAATYLAGAALAAFVSIKAYEFATRFGAALFTLTQRMLAFNASAMVIPAIIGAIILAVGLLIDDYVNWKEGNDSLIGGLVKQFPWLLEMIQGIERGVGALVDFWLEQWNTLKEPVGDLVGSLWQLTSVLFEALWPVVKTIFKGWAYIMAAVIPVVATLVSWIAVGLVNAIATAIGWIDSATQKVTGFIEMVMGAINKVGQLLGLTGDNKVNVSSSSSGGTTSQPVNPLSSSGGVLGMAGNNYNQNSSVTQTTQITGTTIQISSTDPAKSGESVRSELERMHRQTVRNGQSAVAL